MLHMGVYITGCTKSTSFGNYCKINMLFSWKYIAVPYYLETQIKQDYNKLPLRALQKANAVLINSNNVITVEIISCLDF